MTNEWEDEQEKDSFGLPPVFNRFCVGEFDFVFEVESVDKFNEMVLRWSQTRECLKYDSCLALQDLSIGLGTVEEREAIASRVSISCSEAAKKLYEIYTTYYMLKDK